MARPCIIVPGIQGSSLENFYPIPPAASWSTLAIVEEKFVAPDFASLALNDRGLDDSDDQVVTRASQLLSIAYSPLASGLRGRGSLAYLFPYDWRLSVSQSARALVNYVHRLSNKLKPKLRGWDQRFDFACHSMGGLVLRAFLDAWQSGNAGGHLPINRVAFIATPHLGSLEAAVMLISGESPLFGGRKELRKLARTFPAVYELLPRFDQPVTQNGKALNLFSEGDWQRNTVLPDQNNSGFDVQQFHLGEALRVLNGLPLLTEPRFAIPPADILVIYGLKPGSTLTRIHVGPDPDKRYNFDAAPATINGVAVPAAERGDGDDVVPVESALLKGIQSVEVHSDDVSYFTHPILRVMVNRDLHALIPGLDEVQTIVARFFNGQRGADLLPIGISPARLH